MCNDVLLFALAPRDFWLSEHIPLYSHPYPPFFQHTQTHTPRRYNPLCPYTTLSFLVLFLTIQLAVTHIYQLIHCPLLSLSSSVLFCIFEGAISLYRSICPSGRDPNSAVLNICQFCLVDKLAFVFNHLHSAKSYEVIRKLLNPPINT